MPMSTWMWLCCRMNVHISCPSSKLNHPTHVLFSAFLPYPGVITTHLHARMLYFYWYEIKQVFGVAAPTNRKSILLTAIWVGWCAREILSNEIFVLANSFVYFSPTNCFSYENWQEFTFGTVKFFSKFYFGYFDPINIFLDNKNKYFSGWPRRYFG